MTVLKSNLVVLDDYRKGRVNLSAENVGAFLEIAKEEIRKFDVETYDILQNKHTIKIAEACRARALRNEQRLSQASDWLSDKIDQTESIEKITYEKHLKECQKQIERNERVKKNIVDDLASCRHYENKRELIKVLGFALVTPVTVFNVVKSNCTIT